MIRLSEDLKEGIIFTNWILKLNKDSRKKTTKQGINKVYVSYFTSFPQELYDFFEIKDDKLFLVKVVDQEYDVIITDTKPTLPVNYIAVKLITRRKNYPKENRIPTTSFTLSKKLFNNLDGGREVLIRLHPKRIDRYRNKMGLVTLKII